MTLVVPAEVGLLHDIDHWQLRFSEEEVILAKF
jgi:hypothetical protein